MDIQRNKSFWIILAILFTKCAKAKIGYFWHITDIHLDTFYSTKGDALKSCGIFDQSSSSSSGYKPGRFGDYHCDSPWSLLESATNAMKSRQGDNVEFVLWTGDGLSDSSRRKSEPHRIEILRNITDLLGRTFSSQFVFPVLGHNDGPDKSFRQLGELWRQWLPSEALQTFEKGGYYTIEQTKSRLRIIALNTNFMQHDSMYGNQVAAAVRKRHPNPLDHIINNDGDSNEYKNFYYYHGNNGYYKQHHYNSDTNQNGYKSQHHQHYMGEDYSSPLTGNYDNQETQKQWDWLEDVLAKSKINKETVYIVGHMPPGYDERIIGVSQQPGHSRFTEKNNLRYLRLIRKYSSIIQGQFFGHLHSDSFRIIYDDKGKPVSWIMISPSVTPRKMSVGPNNPAMRLYKFDTDSGQVLDYTQYYLDLKSSNLIGEANWIPEYNLTHYYGLVDISAVSLHNLADRFATSDNFGFLKYHRANTVRLETDTCDGICILNHYCAITRVDYMEYRHCLEKEKNLLRSNSTILKLSPILFILITIILIISLILILINLIFILLPKIYQYMKIKELNNKILLNKIFNLIQLNNINNNLNKNLCNLKLLYRNKIINNYDNINIKNLNNNNNNNNKILINNNLIFNTNKVYLNKCQNNQFIGKLVSYLEIIISQNNNNNNNNNKKQLLLIINVIIKFLLLYTLILPYYYFSYHLLALP